MTKNQISEKAINDKGAALQTWLLSLPGMKEARAGEVSLCGQTFDACLYKQEMTPPEGARNPAAYVVEALYVLGDRPKDLKRGHWCFAKAGDAREWFVSGYYDVKNFKPEFDEFNPFGVWFRVSPWTAAEKIDQNEPRKYKRTDLGFTANK